MALLFIFAEPLFAGFLIFLVKKYWFLCFPMTIIRILCVCCTKI